MSAQDVKEEYRLIRKILAGSSEDYRVLVNRYSPMVFHIVRRFETNEADVKDLAQEIFVKTYDQLSQFNGKARFSSWLYTLAMNHCRDYAKNIRRQNKNFSELEEKQLEDELQEDRQADQPILESEQKKALQKALGRLQPEYAEPLLLKYQNGLTYESISEQTGVTVSALKVRVHRARKELRRMLLTQDG